MLIIASLLCGLAILVASFWFKQHGAVFAMGGVLYLTGAIIMCFNLIQTIRGRLSGERAPSPATVAAE